MRAVSRHEQGSMPCSETLQHSTTHDWLLMGTVESNLGIQSFKSLGSLFLLTVEDHTSFSISNERRRSLNLEVFSILIFVISCACVGSILSLRERWRSSSLCCSVDGLKAVLTSETKWQDPVSYCWAAEVILPSPHSSLEESPQRWSSLASVPRNYWIFISISPSAGTAACSRPPVIFVQKDRRSWAGPVLRLVKGCWGFCLAW